MSQAEIDEQYIQTLDINLYQYYQTLLNEVYLNLGLSHNGKPQHDPSWATSRYIQIIRIQKVIQEFEVILAQNKIEEKRTLIQVKCVSKWISNVKDKVSLAQNLAAKLTILRRDFFNENDTESQSGEIAKEIKITGQKTA